jgi:hypothetical protein
VVSAVYHVVTVSEHEHRVVRPADGGGIPDDRVEDRLEVLGDREITPRISLVAVCCSWATASRCSASVLSFNASARRFSRSRSLELSFLCDLGATGSLASMLGFAGFARRRIGLSSPVTGVTTEQRSTTG